jgi:hypothetical protein
VIKYQPTNQEEDDSTVNEVGVFTFAIVKTESKSNCNGCENESYVHWRNATKISLRYRKGCRQLLRVIEKNVGWLPTCCSETVVVRERKISVECESLLVL